MDKSCANHPESMALATCKACDKSICLMCVVDEKEGTFCSTECHGAFVEGREVPKYVESAEPASVASSGSQKIESIFDDGPSASPAASEGLNLPPSSDDPMPIVAEGTKWRSIGTQCDNHADTPAVANCDRCGKPVCALCLLEAAQGTFCSSDCMGATARQPAAPAPASPGRAPAPAAVSGNAERAALQGKPVFKFKEPARTNKSGLIAVLAIFAIVFPVGGYYSWKVFAPESDAEQPVVNIPDPVVDPRPVDPPPVDPPPVIPKPVDPNPPVVVRNPDPPVESDRPGIILKPRVVKTVPTKTLHPWIQEKPGSWYRLQTTVGGKKSYTDIGLKEKSDTSYTLAITTSTGQTSEKKVEAPSVYLRGETTLTFNGTPYLCETQTPTTEKDAPKTLMLISGKYPGAVFKSESPEAPFAATKVWEYSARVKNRSFDCLVIEGTSGKHSLKTYYTALPIQMIRQEKDGESTVLVDFGDDWGKRPAFPTN